MDGLAVRVVDRLARARGRVKVLGRCLLGGHDLVPRLAAAAVVVVLLVAVALVVDDVLEALDLLLLHGWWRLRGLGSGVVRWWWVVGLEVVGRPYPVCLNSATAHDHSECCSMEHVQRGTPSSPTSALSLSASAAAAHAAAASSLAKTPTSSRLVSA